MTRTCRPDARLRALLIPVLVLGAVGAAQPAAAADADHLILSEIVTTVQRAGSRFIEIVNPTGATIPLEDVYLTTGTNALNNAGYWRIVEDEVNSGTAGGGTGGTFHGRFPDGAVIAAGDTVVVSVTGSSGFLAAYGHLPDYEVFEDGAAPDAVPELVEAFPGAIDAGTLAGGTNAPTLNTTAGSVVLYSWDGSAAEVQDLDYFCWGANTAYRVDKTGYGTYLADTAAGSQHPIAAALVDRHSYMRNSADEDSETATGGNGLTGHDETSENFTVSWADVTPQAPAAAPSTWLATAPIFGGAEANPPVPSAGQSSTVTATVVSGSALSAVQLHYTVDGGAEQTVAAAAAGGAAWTATIPGQTESSVVAWWFTAANAAGGSATYPSAAPRFTSGWITAAPPPPCEGKLLLTEICTLGTAQEFVEIWNPNDVDVDMSDYYLTDAVYSTGNQGYWNIGLGNPTQATIGGGDFYDFESRFPDGFTIVAGDTIVVSIAGSDAFMTSFGFLPDLELFEDGSFPDDVPDMRPVFEDATGNSIVGNTTPSLTNTGEIVVLYRYHDGDDLVSDVDMFFWHDAAATTTSYMVDKTGISIGSSTYKPDTPIGSQHYYPTQLAFGNSYVRVDPNEGTQVETGGNGVCGSDETSEDLQTTFQMLPSDPSRPRQAGPGPEVNAADVDINVAARTFLPALGERFPIGIRNRTAAASETRLRIFDQNGRLVVTLYDSRSPSTGRPNADGFTYFTWDGRDDTFQRVPAGMYIAHLSVVSTVTGDETIRTAPVVVATRLSK